MRDTRRRNRCEGRRGWWLRESRGSQKDIISNEAGRQKIGGRRKEGNGLSVGGNADTVESSYRIGTAVPVTLGAVLIDGDANRPS